MGACPQPPLLHHQHMYTCLVFHPSPPTSSRNTTRSIHNTVKLPHSADVTPVQKALVKKTRLCHQNQQALPAAGSHTTTHLWCMCGRRSSSCRVIERRSCWPLTAAAASASGLVSDTLVAARRAFSASMRACTTTWHVFEKTCDCSMQGAAKGQVALGCQI